MKISEIIQENIFTSDYKQVKEIVGQLYQQHYDVDIGQWPDVYEDAVKSLMKIHPTHEELEYIQENGVLPDRFAEIDFPLNDDILNGKLATDDALGEQLDTELDEAPASRKLCQSSKSDKALGASNLSSCRSQGLRARGGKMRHKVGSETVRVNGRKIQGKKYGGPLPDWS